MKSSSSVVKPRLCPMSLHLCECSLKATDILVISWLERWRETEAAREAVCKQQKISSLLGVFLRGWGWGWGGGGGGW